ncbi:MAG: thrombospondin type 3 repeat-containing protein [Dehalococcoidia bacterium]|nr:MAG: thrombospondin type 3 repeat-containing protein [Dehalococcoidia bacterium]
MGAGTDRITAPVIKEWDSIVGSVILKYGDLEKVGDWYLPKDVNNDGKRDAEDEHELDRQSTWQDHEVVWDEALKRVRVPVPIEITEIVHGEHEVLVDSFSIVTHQPTQGAVVFAVIDSDRNCTFFTDEDGSVDLGNSLNYVTDGLGRVTVYIDTVCEEQAIINFYADFPPGTGSLRVGHHEWIGINWTTVELAKQPQIRWAGEEIVLEKRWALPDDWFPNENADGTLKDICPHVFNIARYNRLTTSSAGDLVGGIPEIFEPYTEPDRLLTVVDAECISRALASSEDQGEGDFEVTIHEWEYEYDPDLMVYTSSYLERMALQAYLNQLNAEIEDGTTSTAVAKAAIYAAYYDAEWLAEVYLDPDSFNFSEVLNKHAFLVWWLKIYQVKLTNVDGERDEHNAGDWNFGDGEDTEGDTLNVSADTLLRVKVKGWFEGGNNSGRGAVCVDLDGDGNGLDPDDEEATEPGVPYQLPMYETGCPDPDDEILDHGHWVLPDDLEGLAGPDAINTRPNWDVMSDPEDAATGAIGPKSTLDSHDAIERPWLDRKTVAPDGEITEADAIMPPLKLRASIADDDAGFLKQAMKGDIYGNTNDYHSIHMPAHWAIPAMVNDGGYDWASYDLPGCPDADNDGVSDSETDICDADDLCLGVFDPTNGDLDSDDIGDACDPDIDGDTVLNVNDNCELKSNATQDDADVDGIGDACDNDDASGTDGPDELDSDGDTVPDYLDNCDTNANDTQVDTDLDGYGDACDAHPNLAYYDTAPVPYDFWTIINKFGADGADFPTPYYIEIYTDNRGEGMFFANGDHNLSFEDCRTDPNTGAPDCSPGDVVGESNITVIGDYPYYRKHTSVQSNPVIKTWEWGGFKSVTAERIDATHTAIIAHLVDRDGYCKWDVDYPDVVTSPSLNPVQGEEIEFILNSASGSIINVSANGAYTPPAPHDPRTEATVTDAADGFINASRDNAVALAEDARVLAGLEDEGLVDVGAREVVDEEECQAWVLIEHPLGEDPDVSVRFNDPEGVILRHWPPSVILVNLVQGWNDVCYVDDDATVEDALDDVIDDVLAVYRFNADQTWDRHFPGQCDTPDLCTLDDENTLESYDQLFILMGASAIWEQVITAVPFSVDLAGASSADAVVASWNSVCYAGVDKPADEATSDISSAFEIMYTLGADQAWRRYVPDRPDIPDTLTTLHQFDSVILLVTAEGGITWVFDP